MMKIIDARQKDLIDKWEKRLEMLNKEYTNNLVDRIHPQPIKNKKHLQVTSRIQELEMCIKDLKKISGVE